ncbi:uncharacterized protein LOC135371781 [Ornithodoros turicata]|uniref:uncharacterized protein LOC135371781 n=1 Tax=Ornithodoros turicata TaxID=34597 RepID=UPI0031396A2B
MSVAPEQSNAGAPLLAEENVQQERLNKERLYRSSGSHRVSSGSLEQDSNNYPYNPEPEVMDRTLGTSPLKLPYWTPYAYIRPIKSSTVWMAIRPVVAAIDFH